MKYKIFFSMYYVLTVYFLSMSLQAQSMVSKKSKLHNFIRCTRRYTPGMCIEPVISVWTFMFQLQNCTERYGCPTELRANRFNSYERCKKRCKPLVNLYTEILANDTQSLAAYLRSKSWASSGRRVIDEDYEPEIDEYTLNQHVGGPAPNPLDDDLDYTHREFAVDIDDVDSENTQLDLMGHNMYLRG